MVSCNDVHTSENKSEVRSSSEEVKVLVLGERAASLILRYSRNLSLHELSTFCLLLEGASTSLAIPCQTTYNDFFPQARESVYCLLSKVSTRRAPVVEWKRTDMHTRGSKFIRGDVRERCVTSCNASQGMDRLSMTLGSCVDG